MFTFVFHYFWFDKQINGIMWWKIVMTLKIFQSFFSCKRKCDQAWKKLKKIEITLICKYSMYDSDWKGKCFSFGCVINGFSKTWRKKNGYTNPFNAVKTCILRKKSISHLIDFDSVRPRVVCLELLFHHLGFIFVCV